KSQAKTKTFSVPEGMLSEVRSYLENYKILISKLKQLEEISEKIIKITITDYKQKLKKSG
ncbi:MAG: hypothetical protein NTX88_01315, partial [Candidatus Atribacteria bacterium]|nr:hypothetical protein [Candidatus Atribacteria bacterium]